MKKIIAFLICTVLLINTMVLTAPVKVKAAQTCELIKVYVDDKEYEVRALNHEYENNLYISLVDLSKAMSETDRAFDLVWSEKDGDTYVILENGHNSEATDNTITRDDTHEEEDPFANFVDGEEVKLKRVRTPIRIGDNDFLFYLIMSSDKENRNVYMNTGELALAMDIDMSVKDNVLYINSSGQFDFNNYSLDELGIECMADSYLVGDVTSGNIYLESNSDEAVAIASTTKLMTYLILKDAMAKGQISDKDTVTFSKKASDLSNTSSGVIKLTEGKKSQIMDVISAMLISSSNECSLALAEHLSGDEASFVELMNQKAKALGFSEEARFYNPHGLPLYDEDVLTTKVQNRLTANDMFILVSQIMETYPEITDITSLKKVKLETLDNFEAVNTNVLLHNIPGVEGLKTGTTDKAQSCLVSAYKTEDIKGATHHIVTIVYGCENAQTQNYLSLILMKYGIQKFNASELGITPDRGGNKEIPADLETMIGSIINSARRNSG